MSKTYSVVWTKKAVKQLQKLPKKQQILIFKWVSDHLDGCKNPKEISGVKKLEGTKSGWRFRVGAYRLLVTIKDDQLIVEIVRIGHRQDIYSNIPKL